MQLTIQNIETKVAHIRNSYRLLVAMQRSFYNIAVRVIQLLFFSSTTNGRHFGTCLVVSPNCEEQSSHANYKKVNENPNQAHLDSTNGAEHHRLKTLYILLTFV